MFQSPFQEYIDSLVHSDLPYPKFTLQCQIQHSNLLWEIISALINLFPEIVYADSASVFPLSRISVHPVYIINACLPKHQRMLSQNRYLYGYWPKEAPIFQLVDILGKLYNYNLNIWLK